MDTKAQQKEVKIGLHLDSYHNPNEGGCHVYLRLRLGEGAKAYCFFPTGVFVRKEHWNKATKEVRNVKGVANAGTLNRRLDEKKVMMRGIIDDLRRGGGQVSEQAIKAKLGIDQGVTLLDYCRIRNEAEGQKLAKSTRELQRYHLQLLSSYDKDIPIVKVTAAWLEAYQQHLLTNGWIRKGIDETRGLSQNSVVVHLRYLRKVINHACKKRVLGQDPFEEMEHRVTERPSEKAFLGTDEIELLHNAFVSRKLVGLRYRVGTKVMTEGESAHNTLQHFLVGIYTGLRLSDVKQLTPSHIDGEHIQITTQKTGRRMRLKITQRLREVICLDGGPLFLGSIGASSTCSVILKRIASHLGIRKQLSFHASRHSFATEMLRMTGGNVKVVSSLLGHSSTYVTDRYLHLVNKDMDDAMDTWDEAPKADKSTGKLEDLLRQMDGTLTEEERALLKGVIAKRRMKVVG